MINCACGKIHESNYKILIDIDEDTGQEFYAWALCVEHTRHQPCRACMAREAVESGYYSYREALDDKLRRIY